MNKVLFEQFQKTEKYNKVKEAEARFFKASTRMELPIWHAIFWIL
jgi:hypothetical protein